VAAVLCALQQQQQRAEYARGACAGARGCWPLLRMAVLCSGFPSPCAEHAEVLRAQAPLRLPSLHIYGGARDADRQVRGLPATVRAPLSTRRTAEVCMSVAPGWLPRGLREALCVRGAMLLDVLTRGLRRCASVSVTLPYPYRARSSYHIPTIY